MNSDQENSDSNEKGCVLAFEILFPRPTHWYYSEAQMLRTEDRSHYYILELALPLLLNTVESIRFPSSSCSATSRTGRLWGMIRRGLAPGTTE